MNKIITESDIKETILITIYNNIYNSFDNVTVELYSAKVIWLITDHYIDDDLLKDI